MMMELLLQQKSKEIIRDCLGSNIPCCRCVDQLTTVCPEPGTTPAPVVAGAAGEADAENGTTTSTTTTTTTTTTV